MTMRKLEKILEKLDPSLFKTVTNKCPCPFPENVMILINAWLFIRISVVHASLDNQCDIPKTRLWLHAERHTSQRGTKIPQYLNEPAIDMNSDPLVFWKNSEAEYPYLAKLANKYLVIQASSAAVERLFSIGGKIFRPDRCRLNDEAFERH